MEFKKGFGSYLLTEPVGIGDVLNTLSYANRALILFFVGLMVSVFQDGLIQTGIPFESGDDAVVKYIKNRCKRLRHQCSFCTFHEVDGDTAQDPPTLINTLRLNLWDAACSYGHIPAVQDALKKLHSLFKAAIEEKRIPEEAYDPNYGAVERNPLLFTTLDAASEMVRQRVFYGTRSEIAPGDGYTASWSNGGARWVVLHGLVFEGEEITLDANEIFLVGDLEYLEDMVLKLPELPLYANSLEGKIRKA